MIYSTRDVRKKALSPPREDFGGRGVAIVTGKRDCGLIPHCLLIYSKGDVLVSASLAILTSSEGLVAEWDCSTIPHFLLIYSTRDVRKKALSQPREGFRRGVAIVIVGRVDGDCGLPKACS